MPKTTWRLAKSLEVLLQQLDARWPKRNKARDGSIGDAKHSARESDHNPNGSGVVCALDVTNDPPNEVHASLIAEAIRSSRDSRVKYIIYNHFMMRSYAKPGIPAWTWAPYSGPNSHDSHIHISVLAAKADDAAPWLIGRRAGE